MAGTDVFAMVVFTFAACGQGNGPGGAQDNHTLQVANHHGPVVVRAVKDLAHFDVKLTYSGPDEPARHDEIRVAQSLYEKTAQVLIDTPDGDAPDITVAVEVLVPEDTYFEVLAPKSDITLEGMTGGGSAQTDDGTIRTIAVGGALSLQTRHGDLDLDVRVGDELIQAQTNKGNITLSLPKDSNAAFNALATSGSLNFDGIKLDGYTAPNAATGTFGENGGRIAIETGGGDITVRGL